jgi:hypothetical protein
MSSSISPNGKFRSEQVVVSAPLSFAGSAQRIWRLTDQETPALKYSLIPVAVVLIALAWCIVLVWYCTWGLLLVPYRLIRRGNRKDKVRAMQHREQLEALTAMQQQQVIQTSQMMQKDNSL